MVLTLLSSSMGIDNGGGVSQNQSTGVKGITSQKVRAAATDGSFTDTDIDLCPISYSCCSCGQCPHHLPRARTPYTEP